MVIQNIVLDLATREMVNGFFFLEFDSDTRMPEKSNTRIFKFFRKFAPSTSSQKWTSTSEIEISNMHFFNDTLTDNELKNIYNLDRNFADPSSGSGSGSGSGSDQNVTFVLQSKLSNPFSHLYRLSTIYIRLSFVLEKLENYSN